MDATWTRGGLFGAALALAVASYAAADAAAQELADGPRELPEAIPIFPLPDATLFPNSTQPFHIFEPRYREMVADALAGDSIIGLATLRPGYEADYEGRPPVYDIGCAGVILASERLPDGRYNIVVRGLVKVRIGREDGSRSYRTAQVEALPEVVAEVDRPLLARQRRLVEQAVRAVVPEVRLPGREMPDEQAIDALSLMLPLPPGLRQELLEAEGPVERATRLLALLGGSTRAGP